MKKSEIVKIEAIYGVKVYESKLDWKLCDVSLEVSNLVIKGLSLRASRDGKSYFLAFPSFKSKDKDGTTTYHDYVFPLDKETREALTEYVTERYENGEFDTFNKRIR